MNALRTRHSSLVDDIVPVFEAQPLYNPADYFWTLTLANPNEWMWYLKNVRADLAWNITKGNSCVKVAVTDGGVDINHPDLIGKIVPNYDFYSGGTLSSSGFTYDHGNNVIGLIASETTDAGGTPSGQSLSLGYNTNVMASKSMSIAAVVYASTVLKADIVSISWYAGCGPTPQGLAAEQEINDNGTLIVRAAGNMLSDFTNHCGGSYLYPFSGHEDDRTLVVSGSWKDNYHRAIKDWNGDGVLDIVTHNHNSAVDICAPSYDILSLIATENAGVTRSWPYLAMGGTSNSTPLVAATAALMKSVNPCLNNVDLATIIESTAYPLVDASSYPGQVGSGRLDVFAAVIGAQSNGTTLDITTNTLWNQPDKYVKNTVTIQSGVLTITGTVRFAKDAKLIIKPGAKVVIDGGKVTSSSCSCSNDDSYWEGIEVWGQSSQRQVVNLQGTLELVNGAIIENAICGVRMGNQITAPNNYDATKGGGIIFATNSIFRNNKQDIEFRPYHNWINLGGLIYPMKNGSYFEKCEFVVNEPLPNLTNLNSTKRAYLREVDGVKFTACKFHIDGTALTAYPINYRGHGILVHNSSFIVNGKCSVSVPPGSECEPGYITAETIGEPGSSIIPSEFANFNYAIQSIGADGYSTTSVSGTLFNRNLFGLFLHSVDEATIYRNRFIMESPNNSIWTGAYILGCTGYKIERNLFEGIGQLTKGNTGIWISDSADEPNRIYLNDFINLQMATIAQGVQVSPTSSYDGLEILCGKYLDSKYNIMLQTYNGQPGQIAFRQGDLATLSTDYTKPAGNLFTQTTWSGHPYTDYYVCNTCNPLVYEHHNATSSFPVTPIKSNVSQVVKSPNIVNYTSRLQACPIGTIPTISLMLKQPVEEKIEEIELLQLELSELIDNGNTKQALAFINNPNNSSDDIRAYFLPQLPYLSDEVLFEIINRNPSLNQWHLCELLIGCSPLNISVLESIDNSNLLSTFLYDHLMSYQSGSNEKLNKEIALKKASQIKSQLMYSYVRACIENDDEKYLVEEAKSLLEKDNDKYSIRKRVGLLRQQNKIPEAIALLEEYEEDPLNDNWKQYMTILLDIDQSGGYDSVTTAHIAALQAISLSDKHGCHHADALLEIITGIPTEIEFNLPEEFEPKRMIIQPNRSKSERPSLVGVYPNPAVSDFYITYLLPTERESAYIRIYDSKGSQVLEENITNGYGILNLNTHYLSMGSYVFELILNNERIAIDKFHVIK